MRSFFVLQVRGFSGAGKTTLIERTLPVLRKEGLFVGVLKHTAHHRLSLDAHGKDTDRFYRAGADFVLAYDSAQGFSRFAAAEEQLDSMLDRFPSGLDLVLVEGLKDAAIPAFCIHAEDAGIENIDTANAAGVLDRGDSRYVEKFVAGVHRLLEEFHSGRSLRAGLLIGGRSRRMGISKSVLRYNGNPLVVNGAEILEKVAGNPVVLLGSSDLPEEASSFDRLPDVPDVSGPMAGMLSAFRWDPDSSWIISAVDMPLMHKAGWEWLLSCRRAGAWAVLPRLRPGNKTEATAACYEPAIFDYVESLRRGKKFSLQAIADHPKVITPMIPENLAAAWKNVNTPEDWKSISP